MAAAKIKLAIVTPEKDVLQAEADEVVAPGINGEIGLLPGHVPLITALRAGVLTIVDGNKRSYHAVTGGFAEVEGDTVTILAGTCEAAADINVERARQSLSDAEAELEQLGPEDKGYRAAHRKLDRARARLDTAERR